MHPFVSLYLHPHIKGCVSHLGVGICTLLLAGCPVVRGTLTLPVCFCMGNRTFHPLAVDASWVSDQYHKQGYCQAGFSASFTSVSLHGNKPRHLVSTMVLGLLLICIYLYLRSATQLLLVVWKWTEKYYIIYLFAILTAALTSAIMVVVCKTNTNNNICEIWKWLIQKFSISRKKLINKREKCWSV